MLISQARSGVMPAIEVSEPLALLCLAFQFGVNRMSVLTYDSHGIRMIPPVPDRLMVSNLSARLRLFNLILKKNVGRSPWKVGE